MKRLLMLSMILSAISCLIVSAAGQPPLGPAIGPDNGGAVLKMPGTDVSTPLKPALPYPSGFPQPPQSSSALGPNAGPQGSSALNLWNQQHDGDAPPTHANSILEKLKPREGPDPNQDVLVNAGLGPWMISLTSYSGPESAKMAREMVNEMRQTYHLPAFVFNYGLEERRQEYERVKDVIEKQKEFLRQRNLPVDQPLRIRYIRLEEQAGVLVGGYANEQAARRALDDLRNLRPPDPKKVQLHTTFFEKRDPKNPSKIEESERCYVNPFREAFLVRNPATKVERPSTWDQPDLAALKKLNEGIPYSLLECKKPITLAIKQFQTLTVVQAKAASGGFLENLGFGKTKGTQHNDQAAANALILAALLREGNLPAYVLNTRYASIVTVGEFDSLNDPNLKSMQNLLTAANLQNIVGAKLKIDDLRFFATPMPMPVPRELVAEQLKSAR